MKIVMPLKPLSINVAFQGRRFKTKVYKDFENDFFLLAPKKKMIKGDIEIEYKFYLKNCKMSDYDNQIKCCQDLIVKCGWIEDDRKIYKATIYKIPSNEDRIEIKISKYEKKI